MAEFPALPLWTDAYLADTGHLTFEEHGLYLNLLVLMWRLPECQIPNDDIWIERRFPGYANAVRSLCQEFCMADAQWIWQKRLKKEWLWCREKKRKNKQAADARWSQTLDKTDADASITQYERNAPITTPTPLDDDASAKATANGSISQDAINLADRIAVLVGYEPKEIPPSWCGAAFKVQAWLSGGWSSELIFASTEKQLALKGKNFQPSQIGYFEKGIADFIAQQSAPLPKGNANGQTSDSEYSPAFNGGGSHNGRGKTRDDTILAGMRHVADKLARDRRERESNGALPIIGTDAAK